jgi:hypothetical protein
MSFRPFAAIVVIGVRGALKATPLRGRSQPSLDRTRLTARPGQYEERPPMGALDASKAALAQRMYASGESGDTLAAMLGVSRATVYRVLGDRPGTCQTLSVTLRPRILSIDPGRVRAVSAEVCRAGVAVGATR